MSRTSGVRGLPYLVSVPDPYDSLSPYHNWGPIRYSASCSAASSTRAGSCSTCAGARRVGRVRTVTLVGSKGDRTVRAKLRQALGLRSTWFTIGTLALDPPVKALTYGSTVKLNGSSRGIPRVTLESRPYGGTWTRLATLRARGGRVSATLSPKVTTDYRLSSGFVRSGVVRLPSRRRCGCRRGTTAPPSAAWSGRPPAARPPPARRGGWKTVAATTSPPTARSRPR